MVTMSVRYVALVGTVQYHVCYHPSQISQPYPTVEVLECTRPERSSRQPGILMLLWALIPYYILLSYKSAFFMDLSEIKSTAADIIQCYRYIDFYQNKDEH